MSHFRLLFVTMMLSAAAAYGQCNPHPLYPNGLKPCPTIADQVAKATAAAVDFNNKVADLNGVIDQARRRFWAAFPKGPGVDAAEQEFLNALWTKDMFYMMFAIHQGMTGDVTKMANAIRLNGGDFSVTSIDKFPTNVDGGLRPYAFHLFSAWVSELRRSEGREKDGTWANPALLAVAVKDNSNWHKAYLDARNWAEFMSSGKDIAKYLTPEVYIRSQMEADVCGALGLAKPADLPDPEGAALDLYKLFVKAFGEKEVLAAANTVLHAPKNSVGGLASRAEVDIGSYIASPSPNPYFLFLTEATKGSARAYAVALAFDPNALLNGGATAGFNNKENWEKAYSVYTQLVAKYGEANVLAASGRLKSAQKSPQGTILGDQQAQPLRYWFQALLKDAKAVIPDGQVPHFRASSYDPRWVGKFVDVRGTVSRVAVDTSGSPRYATIYFKEASKDGITGFCPYSDMLQSSYGNDFAGLMGKQVELVGDVNTWREGGGVRILDLKQIKVLDSAAAAADFKESRPDWLTGAAPASTMVDSPKYLAWKKFPPGTKVVYETRLLSESSPGTDLYTRSTISRITMNLDSIDEKRAAVTASSTIWGRGGQATQSAPSQLYYQAKENPPVPRDDQWVVTGGEETLNINGKKIPTKWENIARARDPMEFTKTWHSDDVPGALVLEHRQSHTEIGGKPYRTISETIYAPIDGVMPVLGDGTPPATGAAGRAAPGRAAGAPPQSNAAPAAPPPVTPAPRASAAPTPGNSRGEFVRHYSDIMNRASRARIGLARLSKPAATLPADVSAAAGRLDAQIRATRTAMGARNDVLAAQDLSDLEDSVKVVENFLAK
jgi:hypothetical protein